MCDTSGNIKLADFGSAKQICSVRYSMIEEREEKEERKRERDGGGGRGNEGIMIMRG